jgi:hypothetical protein
MESLNSTARLTVLGEPPSFLATEKDVSGPETGNVTISCQANGLPLPKITWFRGNTSVASGTRLRKQPLGDLTIVGVMPSDEGEYRYCLMGLIKVIRASWANTEIIMLPLK